MDKEEISKWLLAAGKTGIVTRCKLRCGIYSDLTLKGPETISMDGIEITLSGIEHPATQGKKSGLFLTLQCESVIETDDIDIAVSVFKHNLKAFFVLARAQFLVKEPIHKLVECNNEWIGTPGIHFEGASYRPLDADFIKNHHTKLATLNRAMKGSNDLSRKLKKAMQLLMNAMELENLWSTESFLNYYKVIEIAADELKKAEYRNLLEPSDLVEDLIELIADQTQKLKVYFIYVVFNLTEFDKRKVIRLGSVRNKIAHSSYQPSPEEMRLCKNVSFVIFSKFVDIAELRLDKKNS